MPTKYDEVLYPTSPRKEAHPERLATMAHLVGLQTAPLGQCRVLELGCGDGGNLIPIAFNYPGSQFLGLDLAELPLAAGREFSSALGLRNVEFEQGDLATWSAPGREFDYIIAHGVYSWVPPAAREGVLRICQEHLAPKGVAFVSYNALPGCHFREIVWDMMKFHTRGIDDPEKRVASAKEFARKSVAVLGDGAQQAALKWELEEFLNRHDQVVFHDDLAEFNTPFYVEEFTAQAAGHGMQYMGDADPIREHGLPFDVETGDRDRERQYADFISSRRFRETLLCREEAELTQRIELDQLMDLWVTSSAQASPEEEDGTQTFAVAQNNHLSTTHPVAKAALLTALKAWPEMIPARDLPLPGKDKSSDLDCLLRLMMSGALEFRVEPPQVSRVTSRPQASALARAQLALGGRHVVNQRHYRVNLEDEIGRELLQLLDGTRDHEQVAAAMLERINTPELREGLHEKLELNLRMLARLSLLTA